MFGIKSICRQGLFRGFGDTKINHRGNRLPIDLAHQNVAGLDVTMNDALVMRMLDSSAHQDK